MAAPPGADARARPHSGLLDPGARELAPRARVAPRSIAEDRRARLALRAAGLSAQERALLAALPGGLEAHGGELWLDAPREALAALAVRSRAAALLLAAHDAAARPRDRALLVGVLNATPDSFSDGGRHADPERAVARGEELLAEGADELDVGGESTRPGAQPVPAEEELRRVLPVLRGLLPLGVPLSVDTAKAEVAARALEAGATRVNDVTAGRDPEMLPLVARAGCGYVAMHMQGEPRTMQRDPRYGDPVADVLEALRERAAAFVAAGGDPARLAVDPGIGFGKRLEHNLELLTRLGELRSLGLPLYVGVSRKSFLQAIDRRAGAARAADAPPHERLGGTAAALVACVWGGARWLRVHDVAVMAQAARAAEALAGAALPTAGEDRQSADAAGRPDT